jgi:23S rRNA (pseudouridine1915-N3)-methyltransferase
MKICIVSVGKKHDTTIAAAVEGYEKRLGRVVSLEWRFISPSTLDADAARKVESSKITESLKSSDMVWLLDERGEQVTSPALSSKLQVLKVHAVSRLVLIIGGAYGVDETLRTRADWLWSLSDLVFPHQLVRLLLVEQLYRATEIEKGSGYHHA